MVLQRMIDRTLVEAGHALASQNHLPDEVAQDCKMTFRYGERSYVQYNHLNNADRTCGTLLSHERLDKKRS